MSDILNLNEIKKHLNNKFFNINILQKIDSTNNYLKQEALNSANEGTVVIALEQSSGKGRMSRKFFSPKGGIYMSLLLRPKQSFFDATLVTTAAAVAVCEAIEKYTPQKPQIKWVNDVFINNKKVCGILTETAINTEKTCFEYIIVGIGINLYPPKNGFHKDIKDIAGAIVETEQSGLKEKIIAEILNSFYNYYNSLADKKHYIPYKNRLFILGKKVEIINSSETQNATVLDLDENFHLKVLLENGNEKELFSGEISIKLK